MVEQSRCNSKVEHLRRNSQGGTVKWNRNVGRVKEEQ